MNLKTLAEIPPWEWPDNAASVLEKTLRNKKAAEADRLLAVAMAGEIFVINDDLAHILLSILENTNESEKVRVMAVHSLGPVYEYVDMEGFDSKEDLPISKVMFNELGETLRRLYLDTKIPQRVRQAALEVSAQAPREWHEGAIRDVYSSGDDTWKLSAVLCMQYVSGFEEEILEALKSPNPEIRCEAVRAAGNWEMDEAWGPVQAILMSPGADRELLLAAIEAAACIRPEQAEKTLGHLLNTEDEEIEDAVSEALMFAREILNSEGDEEENVS